MSSRRTSSVREPDVDRIHIVTSEKQSKRIRIHYRCTGDDRFDGFHDLRASVLHLEAPLGTRRCTLDLVARTLSSHDAQLPIIVTHPDASDPSIVWPDEALDLRHGDRFELDSTELLLELDEDWLVSYTHCPRLGRLMGTMSRGAADVESPDFSVKGAPLVVPIATLSRASSPPVAQPPRSDQPASSPSPSSMAQPTPTLNVVNSTATTCSPTPELSANRQLQRPQLLRRSSAYGGSFTNATLPMPRYLYDSKPCDIPDAPFLTFVPTQQIATQPVPTETKPSATATSKPAAYRSPLLLKRQRSDPIDEPSRKRTTTSSARISTRVIEEDVEPTRPPITTAARRPFAAPSFKSDSQRLGTIRSPPRSTATAPAIGYVVRDREAVGQEVKSEPIDSPKSHYSDSVPSEPALVISSGSAINSDTVR